MLWWRAVPPVKNVSFRSFRPQISVDMVHGWMIIFNEMLFVLSVCSCISSFFRVSVTLVGAYARAPLRTPSPYPSAPPSTPSCTRPAWPAPLGAPGQLPCPRLGAWPAPLGALIFFSLPFLASRQEKEEQEERRVFSGYMAGLMGGGRCPSTPPSFLLLIEEKKAKEDQGIRDAGQ